MFTAVHLYNETKSLTRQVDSYHDNMPFNAALSVAQFFAKKQTPVHEQPST
jgi:hypothetical protein